MTTFFTIVGMLVCGSLALMLVLFVFILIYDSFYLRVKK
jgi:hypothetical protein